MVATAVRVKTAVIVPAYNEEGRILRVLRAVKESRLADEILVVNDGSVDTTSLIARQMPGVTVIDLPWNHGKGGAMAAGVAMTKAQVVAFVDADLDGLRGEHIDQILRPVLDGGYDMCVGVFRGGRIWSDMGHRISPYLSGQRAMRRELFEAMPNPDDLRMGVELALTNTARQLRCRVMRVVLRGVSNCHKEQKLGLMRGTAARARMYKEIAQASVRARYRRNRALTKPWS